MVEVKNGQFLEVNKRAFKTNDNSVYFWKMKEEHYPYFAKQTECNYKVCRIKGRPKAERASYENIEEVYTSFNISKSPDFNFTHFNYETGEVLELKFLEANQKQWGNTQVVIEVIFIDKNDNIYSKREFEYIPSFNGTQEKRLQHYKEFFDKYCEEYLEKTLEIPEVEVLKVAYKELFPSGKIKTGWPDYIVKEKLAVRIFGVANNIEYANDKFFSLFNGQETPQDLDYLNRFKLASKPKKQLDKIFKILNSSNSGNELLKAYSNLKREDLPNFLEQIDTFIKENKL